MSDLVGDARTWSPNAQEAVRLLAVSTLMEGRDRVEVAALFKVSVKAVDNWWVRWRADGRDALLSRPRGRRVGEHQVLSEAEQAAVRQAILDHIPSITSPRSHPLDHIPSITSPLTWGFRVSCGRGGK
ncbi:helix-turn-helix domain-containing protein [Streptomyces sp. NEAU-W12]|uniref:helix-turn-helix domain-containing protein n=1 Tax=Streptomyces sp. NEAU-W12 TaxID=2994668 RepID=UPI00224B4206|nr:helix-turn-helix domain-containing protein [Streptomyces sp. NEAU-W12]